MLNTFETVRVATFAPALLSREQRIQLTATLGQAEFHLTKFPQPVPAELAGFLYLAAALASNDPFTRSLALRLVELHKHTEGGPPN